MVRKWTFLILVFVSLKAIAQDTTSAVPTAYGPPTPVKSTRHGNIYQRQWLVGSASALSYGGSFIFLNEAWYKGYPRTSFHTFNDAGEWLQMDKIGHAWTAYHTSRVTSQVWRWSGMRDKKAILLGTGTSLLYMLSIEYLDGRSAQWGWSWPDAGADIFGASLFAAQELGWKDLRIWIKYSSHYKTYPSASLHQRADDLFGKSLPERLLKDYNAQTYWLSLNLYSLFAAKKVPTWLNLALGYGADGMYGGYENLARDKEGNIFFDRRDIKRYRQWYLAPDIDLTKIKTKSRFLQAAFSVFNCIKIPAPALEFSNGKLRGHFLLF
jgi:uncharacterized protein YfiM (DUF2279 family)